MGDNFYSSLNGLYRLFLKDGGNILVHLDKKVDLEMTEGVIRFKQVISVDDYLEDRNKGFVYIDIDESKIAGFEMAENSNPFLRRF